MKSFMSTSIEEVFMMGGTTSSALRETDAEIIVDHRSRCCESNLVLSKNGISFVRYEREVRIIDKISIFVGLQMNLLLCSKVELGTI